MQEILIGITLAVSIISLGLLVLALAMHKKHKGQNSIENFDKLTEDLYEATTGLKDFIKTEGAHNKDTVIASSEASTKAFSEYLKSFNDKLDRLERTISEDIDKFANTNKNTLLETKQEIKEEVNKMREDVNKATSEMRGELNKSLENVRNDNEKQLEKMRITVDEKLTATLEDRVKGAFENVSKRLEAVQQGLGEMKSLSDKVGNLNKAFTNVKTRGGWGEVALESLLEQILSPEQYEAQFHIQGSERVDFAIVMPGNGDEKVYLPIDAKFPLEDYERLVDASESGEAELVKKERKNLADSIKKQAKSIRDKYIKIPKTTPFAVMYLPTEGLYAEVVRDGALCSDLQTNMQVTVCGPTTLTALLNSLQIGFTTLKIQKSSGEIVKQLNLFKKDFIKFTDLIDKTKEKANSVVKSLDDMKKRNDLIGERLSKVQKSDELDVVEDAQNLLEEGE